MERFFIGDRPVGDAEACFVIAEAGVNHNGRLDLAMNLVDVAAEAGADAVKFQTFQPDLLASPEAAKASYQKQTTGEAEGQLAMLRKLALSFDDFARISAYCAERRIVFLSTPFDRDSADFLDRLGMACFKIPSGELVNLPFLAHIGAKKKPVILSTGMGSLDEVRAAVTTLEQAGCPAMAILQCVSNYPAAAADANLRAIQTLAQFGYPTGYSDHTMGIEVALASVALGAVIVEKHFTLDVGMDGPDHRCSLEPAELKKLISGIRAVQSALGSGEKRASAAERDTAMAARRSLFLRKGLARGVVIGFDDLDALRPGDGISPARFAEVIGRKTCRDLPAHHKLAFEDLA